MNKFTFPLLRGAAALPLAFGPSVQGQLSGTREAHLGACQDPDPASGNGWVWVPGDQWAPAWVSWRQTDDEDYVGWAPLPPEASVTVSVGVHSWCDSYYDIGPAAFCFLLLFDFF